jgi:hypothetical protein
MSYFDNVLQSDQERKDHKSAALNNSRMFNKFFWPNYLDYPEIELLTKHIFKEIKLLPTYGNHKPEKKFELEIAVLLIDLFKCHLEDDTQYLAFNRDNNYYVIQRISGSRKKNRLTSKRTGNIYNPCPAGRRLINIVDYLIELEYVDNYPGFRAAAKFKKGRLSRIIATQKLLDLFTKYSIDENSISSKPTEDTAIIFKDEDKKPVEYFDDPSIQRIRDLVLSYNDMLDNTFIDINLSGIPQEGINIKSLPVKINLKNKYYRRVFNDITTNDDGDVIHAGGRYYAHWTQQVPSKLRQRIVMGDPPEETVEIDFSTMHPLFLAAFNGTSFTSDPYTISNYPDTMRPLFKLILLCLINSETKGKALKGIKDALRTDDDYIEFKSEKDNINKIVDDFEIHHTSISNHFYTSAGIRCMAIESKIAGNIIDIFVRNNKNILCVHDSFVCQKKDANYLERAMKECFKQVLIKAGLNPVEAKLKRVVKDFTLLPDQKLDFRYNTWKTKNKQVQFKRLLIRAKK